MNPTGAALLACAALGCAWAAWVSLRGGWRLVVIVLSAALAVLVPVAQLEGSTATTEHAAASPSTAVEPQQPPPAPAPATPAVPAFAAVPVTAPPEVTDGAVDTPVAPELIALPVAPQAEARPVRADDDMHPADAETAPPPTEVPPPPQPHTDAVRADAGTAAVPAAAEAPVELTAQTVGPSSASSTPKHKKAPPAQERAKKAKPKPTPVGRSRRH